MTKPLLILATTASALAFSSVVSLAGEVTWWTPNFNEPRARELVEKFQAANPDITVNLEITTSDGSATTPRTRLR